MLGIFEEILELHKRGGLGNRSPPAGSRGGAPVGVWGGIPPQAEAVKHIVIYYNKF